MKVCIAPRYFSILTSLLSRLEIIGPEKARI